MLAERAYSLIASALATFMAETAPAWCRGPGRVWLAECVLAAFIEIGMMSIIRIGVRARQRKLRTSASLRWRHEPFAAGAITAPAWLT
jgi:hypothetical protein